MALGASRAATAGLISRSTASTAGIGLAIEVVLALTAAKLESSALFGVRPLDALSMVMALGILAAVVAAAVWLPAQHAASVAPMQALRSK